MKKEHDRVPVRQTCNTKKRYGKHREGAVPLTIWEDREFKELLKEEAASVQLPKWSLSDHISFILRDHLGLWDKPYRPSPKRPTYEAPSSKTARK